MKIDDLNQKAVVAHLVGGRIDKSEPADVHGESAAKPQTGTDKVELSSYMPVVAGSKSQPGVRANRVEEVKSQIASGTYQVSSKAVAEKMLSKLVIS